MSQLAKNTEVSEEDVLRADLYDFLSALLAGPVRSDLLSRTRGLTGEETTDLGRAISALSKVAQATTEKAIESEFNRLFIGLGRGELLPYGSYYMTGFLNEKPLAALREDMARRGIKRVETVFEPEDNIASLCEIMSGMIRGRFGQPAPLSEQRAVFSRHIAPWATHFFTDLEGAKASLFYAPVGRIGQVFMAIEKEAFRLAGDAPQ